MFNGSIPEKVIVEKCGHKSIKALRYYEKTSLQQEQVAGHLISGIDVSKEANLETATSTLKKHQETAKPNPVH